MRYIEPTVATVAVQHGGHNQLLAIQEERREVSVSGRSSPDRLPVTVEDSGVANGSADIVLLQYHVVEILSDNTLPFVCVTLSYEI